MSDLNAAFESVYRARQQTIDTNTAVALQGPNLIINAIATGLDAQFKSQQVQAQMQLGMLDAQLKMENMKSQQMMGLLEFDLKSKSMEQDRKFALAEHQAKLRELTLRENDAKFRIETADRQRVEADAAIAFDRVLGEHSLGRDPVDALSTVTESYGFQQLIESNPAVKGVYLTRLQQQKEQYAGYLSQQMNARTANTAGLSTLIRERGKQYSDMYESISKLGEDPSKNAGILSLRLEIEQAASQLQQEVSLNKKDGDARANLLGLPQGPAQGTATNALKEFMSGLNPAAPPPVKDPLEGLDFNQKLAVTPGSTEGIETKKFLDEAAEVLTPLLDKVSPVITARETLPENRTYAVKVRNAIEKLSTKKLDAEQKQQLAKAKEFLDAGNYKEASYWVEAANMSRPPDIPNKVFMPSGPFGQF